MNQNEEQEILYAKFSEADDLWENGHLTEAFHIFKELSCLNYEFAYGNLGVMYELGEGTEQSYAKALFWYKESLRQDKYDVASISNIADLYLKTGKYKRFLFWINKAIRLGDGSAKLVLAKYKLSLKRKNTEQVKILLSEAIESKYISENDIEEATKILGKLNKLS